MIYNSDASKIYNFYLEYNGWLKNTNLSLKKVVNMKISAYLNGTHVSRAEHDKKNQFS
jgi:hypothetical protein